MFYSVWRRCLVAVPIVLSIFSSVGEVSARPAAVFIPHLQRIQSNLPSGLVMRLPSRIPLQAPLDINEGKVVVQVFPSEIPQSFTVSLFTCDRSSHPCLLGSFSVAPKTNMSAKQELERHRAKGDRLTLLKNANVVGYLLEGPRQNPSLTFSTMMWQQNDMIYTISFPAIEKEAILVMAGSMAQEKPLNRVVTRPVSSP